MALKPAQGSVRIIDKATQPLQSIANAFKNLGKVSKNTNTNLSSTQKAISGISAAQNQLTRTQKNISRATSGIGSQALGIVALGLSFKEALQPAIKFEQSMKDLESVAFGSADATVDVAGSMKLLSEQAKQLGASTAFSATQAAEGQIFLAKAGFKTNEILVAMRPLLDLAAASGTELGRASDITSDLLGAFGMKASETAKLADVLAAATSSANVDMETLFETLKVSAPIGIAAGQSMEAITTATSLLGNVGIKGSMAGTALKNAFTNLASPAAEGAKVLKELGIQTADANGNMLPMETILLNLGKQAKNLSQVKRITAFDAVFGKIAMAGAINLEKAVNSGDFAKMLVNLQNSEGVASKMAKIRMDSTEGSFVQLGSAVEGLAITFGTILNPAMRKIAEVLTVITPKLQNFIKENEDLVKVIGLVAAGILAFKVIALAGTAALWLMSPAITALKVALGLAKVAMIGFNFVMSANPIGLVVVGVTALATAGVLLYQNWEKVTKVFTNFWDIFKNFNLSDIAGFASKIGSFFGFGGQDSQTQQTQQQVQSLATTSNNTANITVNVADGKVKSVENKGNFKANTFLNNGVQN